MRFVDSNNSNLEHDNNLTRTSKTIIIFNSFIFLLQTIFSPTKLIIIFGLSPWLVLTKGHIWQIFTYMFLHGDLLHLITNMFVLWIFTPTLNQKIKNREFLKYYIFCGISAGIFHLFYNFNSSTPVIGASGAIYGIVAAVGLLAPNRIISLDLFFLFPIRFKAKYFLILVIISFILQTVFGNDEIVPNFVGGLFSGILYLKYKYMISMIKSILKIIVRLTLNLINNYFITFKKCYYLIQSDASNPLRL